MICLLLCTKGAECVHKTFLRITVLSFILCHEGTVDVSVPVAVRQAWREHASRGAPGWSNAHARLRTCLWVRLISEPSQLGERLSYIQPGTRACARDSEHLGQVGAEA